MVESLAILSWITLGIFSGWLVSQITHGQGSIDDVAAGSLGALSGGVVFSILFRDYSDGLIGALVVPFVLAVCLIVALRILPGRSIV